MLRTGFFVWLGFDLIGRCSTLESRASIVARLCMHVVVWLHMHVVAMLYIYVVVWLCMHVVVRFSMHAAVWFYMHIIAML